LNVLSRYLSHALVLVVTLAVGAFVAPAAIAGTKRAAPATGFSDVLAASGLDLHARDLVAPSGCQAPPAIPANATLSQLGALQDRVQTALDGCAARVEKLNRLQATLSAQIATTSQRIADEKLLMAGVARVLYRQPQSPLVALTTSRSLGDFFTEWADMQSAGARAESLSRQLTADQQRLQTQRADVLAAETQETSVRQSLQSAAVRLQQVEDQLLALSATEPAVAFVAPAGPAAIIQDIEDAFNPLGQGAVQWALRVAKCESGYNPNAVNPWSGTEGLFQFEPSTWRETPYGRDNVFDPKYNALGAAWLYQRDGPGQWQCS
jgi:hypothetical protein